MHVVGHMIQDDKHIVPVGFVQQVCENPVVSKTFVHLRDIQRPVSVVSAELGIGIEYLSPGIVRVLRQRRQPYGIYSQLVEKPFFYFLDNAFQVSSVIIYFGMYVRSLNFVIVVRIAVIKPINKDLVYDGRMFVCSFELLHIFYYPALFQRNEQVVGVPVLVYGINTYQRAFREGRKAGQKDGISICNAFYRLHQAVLPKYVQSNRSHFHVHIAQGICIGRRRKHSQTRRTCRQPVYTRRHLFRCSGY